MLDRVGNVDALPVDPGGSQAFVEQLSRRPHERLARQVLLVPRLLADEHQLSSRRSLAEHGLGGVLPEAASSAGAGGPSEARARSTPAKPRVPSHTVIAARL